MAGSGTSAFGKTHCRYPDPSRSTRKAIFPLDRVVITQPWTVTVVPAWRPSSRMDTVGIATNDEGG